MNQDKPLNISEAQKLFEESVLSVQVCRTDRKQARLSFEKSGSTMQFGGYVDTEMSHKFRSYCEALVRVGFMKAEEMA